MISQNLVLSLLSNAFSKSFFFYSYDAILEFRNLIWNCPLTHLKSSRSWMQRIDNFFALISWDENSVQSAIKLQIDCN